MKVVDANVLLYAVNSDSDHHLDSKAWLDRSLSGDDRVGLSWLALLAFVRLSTKVGLMPSPLSVEDATAQVLEWQSAPGAVIVQPTGRHGDVLAGLLIGVGTGGNLTSDAHLAALAIEHRGTVVSYDPDFSRFDGVSWVKPGDLLHR